MTHERVGEVGYRNNFADVRLTRESHVKRGSEQAGGYSGELICVKVNRFAQEVLRAEGVRVLPFVAMQYFGYLRRDPDSIGFNNWVATLTADPNNFRHMIFGFLFSDEYRHRFGP